MSLPKQINSKVTAILKIAVLFATATIAYQLGKDDTSPQSNTPMYSAPYFFPSADAEERASKVLDDWLAQQNEREAKLREEGLTRQLRNIQMQNELILSNQLMERTLSPPRF